MHGRGWREEIERGNNVIKFLKIKVIKFRHFNRNIKHVSETRPADRHDSNSTGSSGEGKSPSLPPLRKGSLGPESQQSTWQHTHGNPALTSPLPEQWAARC